MIGPGPKYKNYFRCMKSGEWGAFDSSGNTGLPILIFPPPPSPPPPGYTRGYRDCALSGLSNGRLPIPDKASKRNTSFMLSG